MKCDEISADWAAQRIKGLSLLKAIFGGASIKTLIDRILCGPVVPAGA